MVSSKNTERHHDGNARTGVLSLGLWSFDHSDWLGGKAYVRNLIFALAALPEQERPRVRLLGVGDCQNPAIRDLSALEFVEIPPLAEIGGLGPVGRLWSHARVKLSRWHVLPGTLNEFSGLNVMYPGWVGDVTGVTKIHWIADFQHAHYPDFFSAHEIELRNETAAEIAGGNSILVLSSRAAEVDFRRLYPDARVPVRIWSFCTTILPRERQKHRLPSTYRFPEKYLYVPNQFWVHKDHRTAFNAIAGLKEKGLAIPLVCTGHQKDPRHPTHFRELMQEARQLGVDDQIHVLGVVPREQQVQIFRHAAAVIQPSLFEGWSSVVEDSKALGCPLVLSDIPVHREQMAGNGYYFPPGDPEGLANILERLWPRLLPGLDPEMERKAMAETENRRLECARAFLAIINEALDAQPQGTPPP